MAVLSGSRPKTPVGELSVACLSSALESEPRLEPHKTFRLRVYYYVFPCIRP